MRKVSMGLVYTCFTTDIIHEGHLKIIREANKYGEVMVGIMADSALIRFDRFPTISMEERMNLIGSLDGVKDVVVQDDIMYDKMIEKYHPDYVVHGDNWKNGPLRSIRDNAEIALSKYGGKIIDIPYTYNENVYRADLKAKEKLSMPEYRRGRLRKLISLCPVVKALEVHNGLTGLIVEKTIVAGNGELNQFDAMWISSLCDSTAKGKPDIELVDMTSRYRTIDDVMEVTTKPVIFDGDTGGLTEHFVYTVRSLERMGVSAVIIEDKTGLKKILFLGQKLCRHRIP